VERKDTTSISESVQTKRVVQWLDVLKKVTYYILVAIRQRPCQMKARNTSETWRRIKKPDDWIFLGTFLYIPMAVRCDGFNYIENNKVNTTSSRKAD
jgi:hypothetical protein